MGSEGDQLIFSYLSKVGDLAQAAMPPRDRARLVAKLRDDIDRQRGGSDSPAAVRRILGRLGSPDEVVSAASAVPAQREPEAPRPEPVREPEVPGPEPVVPRQADAPGRGDPAPSWLKRTVRWVGEASAAAPGGQAPGGQAPGPVGDVPGRVGEARPVAPGERGSGPQAPAPLGRGDGMPGPSGPGKRTPGPSGPGKGTAGSGPDGGIAGPQGSGEGTTGPSASGEGMPGDPPAAGPRSSGPPGPPFGSGGGEPGPVRLGKGEAAPQDPEPVGLDGQPPAEWWLTPRRRLTLEEIAALPGVTIPLDAPAEEGTGDDAAGGEATAQPDADATAGEPPDEAPPSRKGRRRPRSRARRSAADGKPAPEPRGGRRAGLPGLGGLSGLGGAFMETLAAVALVAGAVLGSWLPLLAGWAMAYYSRRLSPSEAKFAALGLPGTVLVGMMVWLWGRTEGRWGEPIAQGRLNAAVSDAFPWTVRVAAVGSALFILWRVRRRAG